ncbi:hypothetical protein [Ursidibacter arcticus]
MAFNETKLFDELAKLTLTMQDEVGEIFERNGTERNGTERNGTERNGTERNGTCDVVCL